MKRWCHGPTPAEVAQTVSGGKSHGAWGEPPWKIDFTPQPQTLPREVDFAIVGGGFTGLAAAAWLRRLQPEKTVALLEAGRLGGGASGRTGGLALEGTAVGDLEGLGDVLKGFARILDDLNVNCRLTLSGVWEIGRRRIGAKSLIRWQDSGTLGVVREVRGGTVDPGALVAGLARAAERLGVILLEESPVCEIQFEEPLKLRLPNKEIRARRVLLATNAQSLELSALASRAEAKLTLALATAPLEQSALEAMGLAEPKPFYTVGLPYLWGRKLENNGLVFGSGLVHVQEWREFDSLEVASGRPAELLRLLERRVRGLHPALASVEITHRWGGPILFSEDGTPYFFRHPQSSSVVFLGGYCGHGVALSIYLGCWAAEVMAGRREPPRWWSISDSPLRLP